MICPNCKFDYKDTVKNNFTFVRKTYDSYGLSSIQRVRECPNCGYLSLTEEKHTGQEGFPTIAVNQVPQLKTIIKENIKGWFQRFPNEDKLIRRIQQIIK